MSLVKAEFVGATGCCASILWMKSQLTNYDITYEKILKGDNELHFIPTQYQLADIFTKPLDEPTFKRLIVELEDSKIWISTPTGGIRGDMSVTTFRNALRANYLSRS
ncbi:hypothetical protein Tco_1240232, partial [Tanacetum coccineum]